MSTETAASPGEKSIVQRTYARWGKHPAVYAVAAKLVFLGREQELRRRTIESMNLEPGARVLEVGCGTGRDFPYVEEVIGARGRLVGLDYSREMLESARRFVAESTWRNITLQHGDAAVMDVGDEPFDGVFSVLAMSCVPDFRAAIARSRDVLRPGGVLAICDAREFTGPWSLFNRAVRAVFVPLTAWYPDHDLIGAMDEVFGNVDVQYFNAGGMYIATATKQP